ncbi:hypothetical protein ACFORL_01075 [Legionella dresdenensis]|uniref:Uncharacterized protein n=1 Tax=Legionella dresdenensis TaxID=450200 RepID=A0ABV8CBQ9_9GAMM
MPLHMKVFTLNCGNDGPGPETAKKIISRIKNEVDEEGLVLKDVNTDIAIIHCQEADFEKTINQLKDNLGFGGYTITKVNQMVTHTKLMTQFHSRTGLMTFVVHKDNIQIERLEQEVIRRNASRWNQGFNKGGLYTKISVTVPNEARNSEEKFVLALANGHLESYDTATRMLDWANLYKQQCTDAEDWNQLCAQIPDNVASGFDANTRNLIGNNGHPIKPWENTRIIPSVEGLIRAPFGNARFSRPSTYKLDGKENVEDKKRPGYAMGGTLDLVCYNDANIAYNQHGDNPDYIKESEIYLGLEEQSSRDHAVIGSNRVAIHKQSDFDRCKEYIACRLVFAAPKIAQVINSAEFVETEENKNYLVKIYRSFLSSDGLMMRALNLQVEQLKFMTQFSKTALPTRAGGYENFMFPQEPWFKCVDAPQTDEELEFFISRQKTKLELKELCLSYLNSAESSAEKNTIADIVDCAIEQLEKENPVALLLQTKQLLSFFQVLCKYSRHLHGGKYIDDPESKANETVSPEDNKLLQDKIKIVYGFQSIVKTKQAPAEMKAALNAALSEHLKNNSSPLGLHRRDSEFMQWLRKLKDILTGRETLSHGAQFAIDAKSKLGEEKQENPGNSSPRV